MIFLGRVIKVLNLSRFLGIIYVSAPKQVTRMPHIRPFCNSGAYLFYKFCGAFEGKMLFSSTATFHDNRVEIKKIIKYCFCQNQGLVVETPIWTDPTNLYAKLYTNILSTCKISRKSSDFAL